MAKLNAPSGVKVSPSSIDIAKQKTSSIKASWEQVAGAVEYVVLVHTHDGKQSNSLSTTSRSVTFNPSELLGANYTKAIELYVGVKAKAKDGSYSDVTYAKFNYTRKKGVGPTKAYVIGTLGVKNELDMHGETARLYIGNYYEGSFPLSKLVLLNVDTGEKKTFTSKKLTFKDSNWWYIDLSFKGHSKANGKCQYELRTYDSKGNPIYANAASKKDEWGTWVSFTVTYRGGLCAVYGKGTYLGDDEAYAKLSEPEKWRQGYAWVHDGKTWRQVIALGKVSSQNLAVNTGTNFISEIIDTVDDFLGNI